MIKQILQGMILPALALLIMLWDHNLNYSKEKSPDHFYFVQLSDTHWGFSDPKINPDFSGTLKKTVDAVNNLKIQPDFIIFTGDLTHTTDDPKIRQQRMTEFKAIIAGLKVTNVLFIPGEHDAALDNGEIYKANFGKTHYTFDLKGVHFIALDNVSDPSGKIGDDQLKWMETTLKSFKKDSRVIVFAHRPLFNLFPQWDWWTQDGDKAINLLMPFEHVSVFYGHIHQVNNYVTNNIQFHAAPGLMYPLPAPGSVPKKAPVAWNTAEPYQNLGFRTVEIDFSKPDPVITEYPVNAGQNEKTGMTDTTTNIIQTTAVVGTTSVVEVTAKKYEFSPNRITLKKGVPVILEFTTLDRMHGFSCPQLNLKTTIEPGKKAQISFVPDKTGEFDFECSVFCGEGHENMTGKIVVKD